MSLFFFPWGSWIVYRFKNKNPSNTPLVVSTSIYLQVFVRIVKVNDFYRTYIRLRRTPAQLVWIVDACICKSLYEERHRVLYSVYKCMCIKPGLYKLMWRIKASHQEATTAFSCHFLFSFLPGSRKGLAATKRGHPFFVY